MIVHVAKGPDGKVRCAWCIGDSAYVAYHDTEWGRPQKRDRVLFEKISLEGFQSGLSWLTILRKREAFRRAFDGFEIETVASYGKREVDRLLADAGIVRHRGKIESVIGNARKALALIDERGSLARYVWSFEPARRERLGAGELPSVAFALAKDLKRRGFTFVGPTTVHSFMQAMGLINDHAARCGHRHEVEEARLRFGRP